MLAEQEIKRQYDSLTEQIADVKKEIKTKTLKKNRSRFKATTLGRLYIKLNSLERNHYELERSLTNLVL